MSFQLNVERWKKFSPEASEKVSKLTSLLDFNEDPAKAKEWFDSLDKKGTDVFFIYGIGLGNVYEAAKEWLHQNPLRTLIFIEDNLEIIHRFLETERATPFLHDKQVWLEFLNWDDQELLFRSLVRSFALQQYQIVALPYDATHSEEKFTQIHSRLSFWMMIQWSIQVEQVSYGELFFNNFYHSILYLPSSYRASELYGKFEGIPAIICGAGPSLDKNLALAESLDNKALIFAGATALNAVNSHGFVPHFGVGIDPNPAQATRLIANKAYEVPFLYRSRMNIDAFETIHGDALYITGSSGYKITEWFEKELNIPGIDINEGCNVVNFSLSIAHAMKCNPIVLIGVDLAYSDKRSYHSGVASHPTHSLKADFKTKQPTDELVIKDDIFGKPVYTLWKWVAESTWFSQFAYENSETLIINSTEGGIGMQGIPNKPLTEVIQYLLNRQFDLRVMQHGEIQNSRMPPNVTMEKIRLLMRDLQKSLLKCLDNLQTLSKQAEECAKTIERGVIDKCKSLEDHEEFQKLQQEPAFEYILQSFNNAYQEISERRLIQLKNDVSEEKLKSQVEIMRIESQRYEFLAKAASINAGLIEKVLLESREEISKKTELTPRKQDHYFFDNETFHIVEPEMKLSFQEKYASHDYVEGSGGIFLKYPSGSIKMEQFLLDNALHGPTTFYKEDGSILARSWYVKGQQQGKAIFYYNTGQLHSLRRFINGFAEGIQEYYYHNGQLKSSLPYSKGQLNGEVNLYYPNGKMKRELHFINGLRNGKERLWSSSGVLIMEVEYENDMATGTAKKWYPDGQLALEIVYNDQGKQNLIQRWDTNGLLQSEEKFSQRDYFDQVAFQADLLTKSLSTVNQQLHQLAPFANSEEVQQDFVKLDALMNQLQSLNKDLLFESGIEGDNPDEAIWKTPTMQREMQKKLEEMTEKLSQDLQNIQKIVGEINNPK